MGETDRNDGVDARREFVTRLRAHDDVREVNFSRDGFRTVVVELKPDAEFREEWHRTATRLGYSVDPPPADGLPADRPADTWVLRLGSAGQSTDRATGSSALRSVVARVRALLDRLLGR